MTARRLRVVRGGLLTTVQDLGRLGFQSRGVPPAGPMDSCSHRLANLAVGNPADRATLEITLIGPELLFESDARIAVCGAEFQATVDGRALAPAAACELRAGAVVKFGPRVRGARAYLAVDGGIDVPVVLKSRATHLVSRMGGCEGRRLQDGDVLRLGEGLPGSRPGRRWVPELPEGGAVVRVLPGPHVDAFAPEAFEVFASTRFLIAPASDRMAYRLIGHAIDRAGEQEMISDVLPNGGVQVPGSGQPILLMADRATTGGYPIIATVITADLPIAGQLAPGDWIRFAPSTPADALSALIARERRLMD